MPADYGLRGFLGRLLGWSDERAVELGLRSLALALDHRSALVLCGQGDMVPSAWALHRRMLGADRPFVVCDPRRGTRAASVRSPASRATGVAAFEAAAGGSLCVRVRRLPNDVPALVTRLRGTDDVLCAICAGRLADLRLPLIVPAPLAVPPLARRSAELDRIIAEYAGEALAELAAPASSLKHHILPEIGHLLLPDVRTRHLVDLFHKRRTDRERNLAQRTIYNIYSVASALFRDAKLADLIEQSPCVLDERQLGPLTHKDPEWRNQAVFTREEAETMISDARIPPDRQVVYALELLAGVRPGEAAALRWRHYDPAIKPLGKLLVAKSYNTRKNREKSTKTDAVKHLPVHPVLAAMLAEWKLGGWAEMMGRAPTPDDLIVPLPPAAAERRRSRSGEPFRGHDYSGKRWREEDLPALGWRHRRHYDMRATFITLAIDDGADAEILETRVTHTRKSRSAFDGYNRGLHWERTCAEIAKLRIARGSRSSEIKHPIAAGGSEIDPSLVTLLVTATATADNNNEKPWRRRESNDRIRPEDPQRSACAVEDSPSERGARGRTVTPAVASLATALEHAIRTGDADGALALVSALRRGG